MAQSYKVIITPRAERSLERIVDYLLDTASYAVASKVRKGLMDTIYGLAKMPESNMIARDVSTEKITYRRILKWSYRILYAIEENELQVLVVEIHHTKEDPQKIKDSFK